MNLNTGLGMLKRRYQQACEHDMTDQGQTHYREPRYFVAGDDTTGTYIQGQNNTLCVPLTDSGLVIFIVQHSRAFAQDILTLPGGVVKDEERHDITANRELREEIGFTAERLDYLGEFRPWVKYLRVKTFVYLGRHLTPSKRFGDSQNDLATELVPLAKFERLIRNGTLHDSTVIAALYMARQFAESQRDDP